MMIKGAILKLIISSVIKGIEKVPDKRIASNHEKRILKFGFFKKIWIFYENLDFL